MITRYVPGKEWDVNEHPIGGGPTPTKPQWPREEVRNTSTSGGQKGVKPERFSLIPWSSVAEVARVFSWGAGKYADHNWRKGYPWSWSYDALQRHLTAWWDSPHANDPESGMSHLSHAAWHALVLLWFQAFKPEFDDRPKQ